MKKTFATMFVLVVALSLTSLSQSVYHYTFVKSFPDTNFKGNSGAHGIAVDPAGRGWVTPYGTTDSVLETSTGKYLQVRAMYVCNPNGTQASFSPIQVSSGTGIQDTNVNSARGMRADPDGNIVNTSFDTYYRIN